MNAQYRGLSSFVSDAYCLKRMMYVWNVFATGKSGKSEDITG